MTPLWLTPMRFRLATAISEVYTPLRFRYCYDSSEVDSSEV